MRFSLNQLLLVAVVAAACGAPEGSREPAVTPRAMPATGTALAPAASEPTLYPDVLAARATRQAGGTWRFEVTLSSPYDSPDRYADAWRILGPDGTELGVRILTHDHAAEQPFTRSLAGVEIPEAVTSVTIQGRDRVSGWGGATVEIGLPGR